MNTALISLIAVMCAYFAGIYIFAANFNAADDRAKDLLGNLGFDIPYIDNAGTVGAVLLLVALILCIISGIL